MTTPAPEAAPLLAAARPPTRPLVLAWYGCDLKTGNIVEELPSLTPTGPLSRRLGTSTQTSFDLVLGGASPEWQAATLPGRTMLVAVDTATDTPVWAGLVLPRDRGSAPTASITAATLEAYLDRRYVDTYTAAAVDKATVVSDLMANPLIDGPPFQVDAPPIGETMDYTLDGTDDRTVLSALQEVMGMDGGPEWTVDVAWNTDRSGFVLPFRVRAKVGVQAASPEAVFDFPGCIDSYTHTESYEADKGATVVQARGEGEGTSRLSSQLYTATDLIAGGWPRFVYRFTPATGVTDPDQLDAHAAQALALMATGSSVWAVTAVASVAPRLGETWALGDTVRIAVAPGPSPGHPDGADTVARAWAWELDPTANTIAPILVEEDT